MGNPVHIQLSAGNINDSTLGVEMLSSVEITGSMVLADKAYGTSDIRKYIDNENASYCIPSKLNTKNPWECDFWHYKERHLVECFFQKLKLYRRIATRYDKLASRFLSFILLACIMILVK